MTSAPGAPNERTPPKSRGDSEPVAGGVSAARGAGFPPVLAPLLDEFVAVRTQAAVLEGQLDSIKAHAAQKRKRDELLFALATSGWWGRRRTRKAVLRHYVVGDDPSDPGSGAD